VLEPSAFKFRRSLKQAIKKQGFEIRTNTQFETLIRLCASTRENGEGTWITEEMIQAYMALHRDGYAISFETYREDELVGGLYGVKLGQVLFGESMVSLIPDASKAALASLCQESEQHQIQLIDCQVPTSHLESLGASLITRAEFVERINELTV
jgi:leucyl/phenylalanyl-tRNA--protein transferase